MLARYADQRAALRVGDGEYPRAIGCPYVDGDECGSNARRKAGGGVAGHECPDEEGGQWEGGALREEVEFHAQRLGSPETRQALTAFLETRKPDFKQFR